MLCWLVGLNLWCRLLLGGSAVGALDHAIRLLFAAAQTGKRDAPADRRASCRLWLGGFLQTVFRDLLPPMLRKNKHPQG